MTEKTYHRPCSVCSSDLEIVLDTMTEDIAVRPASLPPLAKDKLAVVAVYKRLKGLGAEWQRSHGARGIIYAAKLLETVGVHGGQLDRAILLMSWLKESDRDWSLDSAPTYWAEYQAHLSKINKILNIRCMVCMVPCERGNLCFDHSFCFSCDKVFPDQKANLWMGSLPWCGCAAKQAARHDAIGGQDGPERGKSNGGQPGAF